MKIKQVTFIGMMSVLILFSMCKKDKGDSPANTNGGVDPGGNNSPRLVSFSPESGAIDDTVSITIANFTGNTDKLQVFFGSYAQAKVISVSTSKPNIVIKALVPETTDITTKINVKGDGNLWLVAEKFFTETSPAIQLSGFSPANAFIGDTITLTGAFYKNLPKVNFGEVAARVISQDSKTLKVVVPDNITDATPVISVVVLDQNIKSKTSFHLNAPVIDSVYPSTAYVGQVVRIKGKGFRNSFLYDQVYLDNTLITTAAESNTSIAVNTKNAGLGSHTISVEVAGLKTTAKDPLKLIAPIPPVITSIVEDTILAGNTIEIMGNHLLSPAPEMPATVTTVDQDGIVKNFRIQYNADNEIIAWVPNLSKPGQYKITVTVLSSSVTYSKTLTYLSL